MGLNKPIIITNSSVDISNLATKSDLANIKSGAVRHIQRGTFTLDNNDVSTISLSGFTDVSKMFVVLQGAGLNSNQYGASLPYVDSLATNALKVATKFGTNRYSTLYASYEVVEYY